jgi:ketosteroid isomerase-like protein
VSLSNSPAFAPSRCGLAARHILTIVSIVGALALGGCASEGHHVEPDRDQRVESVRKFYELLNSKDVAGWQQLWAEDARILVPYPPTDFPTEIQSRATIAAGFEDLFRNFNTFNAQITAIYAADDSDAVCVEYLVKAKLITDAEYTNTNIAVFRFENGLISAYHDYFDPRRFQVVVDALPKPKSRIRR